MRIRILPTIAAAAMGTLAAAPAWALGEEGACPANDGPALQANVSGLKDRIGAVKLELYPADAADFLKDDHDLIAQGKFFRRIQVKPPSAGDVVLCMKLPKPGRYAVLVTHNRDGKNKFSFWVDGAGVPGNRRLGRSRPGVEEATVEVGRGTTVANVRMQYLRGLSGFGPIG